MRLHLGKPAFGIGGMPRHQRVADDEAQDGIAQKLELFIVGHGRSHRGLLECRRSVRQCALEQFPIPKTVTEVCFQGFQLRAHTYGCGVGAPPLRLATSCFFVCAMDLTCCGALGALIALSKASDASSSFPASS